MFASILKSKDKTPFGQFMHDFMTSAKHKKKFSAPKQLIAVALSIAERSGLHYIPVAQRKEDVSMFARILKDSAASVKAWQSRTRAVNFTDENFQNWFGDSKLVNPDGTPMPLYHGTPGADIQQMKMSKDGALGAGVYLTPDASFASTYADASHLVRDKEISNDVHAGPNVLKLYASIRKPLYIDHDETTKTHDPMVIALKNLGMPEEKASKLVEAAYEKNGYVGKQVMSRATASGYDGIIQRRNGKITEVVAFSPQQVKSAISNEGTYYRGLPHIQKEDGLAAVLKTSAGATKAWLSRERAKARAKAASSRKPAADGGHHTPNVEADHDKDGVTDAARVGVPGDQVPTPPPIPRLPNLNKDEQAAQDKFASDVEANPEKAADAFLEMVKASKSPNTFGTDDAKMLAKEWTGEPGEHRSARRQLLNTALHQTANAVAKRAFLKHLDTLKEGDEIFVTVGGCGAGKGYSLGNVPAAKEQAAKSKAVWDSAGDQNATENPWIQKEAEKRGLKVTYAYVHADPEVSWADPSRGVIQRANNPNDGRMVDAKIFADSYALGAKNHAAFVEKNKANPNAKFIFIDSAGKPPTQVDSMPKEATSLDRGKLMKFAAQAVRNAKVPQPIKDGSLAGERIWGDK